MGKQGRGRGGLALACAGAVLASALGAGGGVAVAAAPELVKPQDTGAGISAPLTSAGYHRVWAAEGAPRGALVVFLGGSGSSPNAYDTVGGVAAASGFDTIDLSYLNKEAVGTVCSDKPDACFTNLRGSVLYGEGSGYGRAGGTWSSAEVAVDIPNSVVGRLVSLLQYKGMSAYLVPNSSSPYGSPRAYPDWSKLVLSGHSQGGGHALFAAKTFAVQRVAMMSAPTDAVGTTPATWTALASATPADRLFGLWAGTKEGVWCTYCAVNWTRAGVAGSRQLQTTLQPYKCATLCNSLTWHNSTAVDSAVNRTGLLQSSPAALEPVWRGMFTGTG